MIHGFQLGGYFILLDVHSGSVHVVDELFYRMATALEPPLSETCPQELFEALCADFPKEDIREAYEELCALWHEGLLYSEDDYERFQARMTVSPIKAMCLHISHDCNLRCDYCFAGTGDFGTGHRKDMPAQVGKKAIDFLIEKSEKRRNLEVDFFGGEPLLNFDVVREIVEYARSRERQCGKNFRFTRTTNGLLLDDEKIDFLTREMSNIVLSIDGRREVNDRVRRRVDGSGCYDVILPKFKKLVDKRGHDQYYVRGTFTKYNLDFSEDVLHLNSLGFDQVSVEPVVSDPALPYSLTEADLPRIFTEYEKLAQELLRRKKEGMGFNFFHFMLDLDQGPCAIKRLRGCGAGNEYCAVTPDGDIYPCHQFVGNPRWKMGDVFSGTIDLPMKETFAKATVYGKEECRSCWAKFYCSGGCNANNYTYRGDIHKPFHLACELEKKRIECALMIKAALAEEENAVPACAACEESGDCDVQI